MSQVLWWLMPWKKGKWYVPGIQGGGECSCRNGEGRNVGRKDCRRFENISFELDCEGWARGIGVLRIRRIRGLGSGGVQMSLKKHRVAMKKVELRVMAGWQNFIVLQSIVGHPRPCNVESALGSSVWRKSQENICFLPQSRVYTTPNFSDIP